MTGVKPGRIPGMGAMGVEVCSGPGSYASLFFKTTSTISPCFSAALKACPDEAGDGMRRELGAEAAVLPLEGLIIGVLQVSGLGPSLKPYSAAGIASWVSILLWEEGEITEHKVLASCCSLFEGLVSGLIQA